MRTTLLLLALSLVLLAAGCNDSHVATGDSGSTFDAAVGDGAPSPIDVGPSPVDVGPSPIDVGPSPIDGAPPLPDTGPEACATPGAIETQACGVCGTVERFCTSAREWSYGKCMEMGECAAGTLEMVACGRCGTRTRRCTVMCEWDDSGACAGEGSCMPGERTRTDAGCPSGQTRALVCSDACAFEAGACEVIECSSGMTSVVPCGTMCGTQTRTCDATGHWVDGVCTGEGACVPGTSETTSCGLCGSQGRSCSATCAWMVTSACTGEITCAPPPADACIDAMTLRDYSATTCVARACTYPSTDISCACSAGVCAGPPIVLLRGLGGPAGFGANNLAPNDDGSSPAIPIGTTFLAGLRYYGTSYTTVFVNNNGNLSFGAAQAGYTPTFPAMSEPMIAPFWGDVDTRGGGLPARNNVYWHLDATRLIVTWHLVGYYATHDTLQNSFQLIVTDRSDVAPGDFDVELRYESCEWTTGDASGGTGGFGGTPAGAGFNRGNSVDFLALPGSGTAAVLDLCTTSNVGTNGVWRYQVRGGIPMAG